MKKLIFFILLACFTDAAAQTSKGSFLVGSNISYSAEKHNTTLKLRAYGGNIWDEAMVRTHSIAASPQIGYFLMDNMCVGFSYQFNQRTSKAKDYKDAFLTYDYRERSSDFAPFIRYYIPINAKFSVITGFGYGWGYTKETQSYEHTDGNGTISGFYVIPLKFQKMNITGGITYFLNKNVGAELLVIYKSTNYEENSDGDSTSMTLAAGLQVYLHR